MFLGWFQIIILTFTSWSRKRWGSSQPSTSQSPSPCGRHSWGSIPRTREGRWAVGTKVFPTTLFHTPEAVGQSAGHTCGISPAPVGSELQ